MSKHFDYRFWKQYKRYSTNVVSHDTASDRMSYAMKFYHILKDGNASELLSLNNEKRIHVMKSLASLSKYLGCYDKWKLIRERYQLRWSNGDAFNYFNGIIDDRSNYSSMISWIKNAYSALPKEYGNILIYCTLTGLRPTEATQSIQLVHNDIDNYMNKHSMTLEHFRYPQIFIRRTKKAYMSIVTDTILDVARNSGNYSYNAMKMVMMRKNIDMKMSYCRKIFATYLRMNRIETETIDLLQGRIPKSVFVRHYFKPDYNSNKRIKTVLTRLSKVLLDN
jgi:integrase-like protein